MVIRVFLSFTLSFFLNFLVLFLCKYFRTFSQYLTSPLTIVFKHVLILLFIMNLKMTVGRSKCHLFLTSTFLVKPICKNLLTLPFIILSL